MMRRTLRALHSFDPAPHGHLHAAPSLVSPAAMKQQFEWCKSHTNPGVGRTHDLMISHARGSHIYTTDGGQLLDFGSGIGVCNLGHCHPRLVKAVQEQAGKLWHSQVCYGFHTPMMDLMQKLEPLFADKGLTMFNFVTTGAEAVEAALKLSRAATGRQVTAVAQGGYHGRTVATAAMTSSKFVFSRGMKPLMPGVVVCPSPYFQHHKSLVSADPTATAASLAHIHVDELAEKSFQMTVDTLHQQCHPSEVSMFIMEPVLGEGGYVPISHLYYKKMREFCKENGIMFVVDEVQTGFGRTGRMFAFERFEDVESPDCVVFAKGIASGMPIAGIVAKPEFAMKQIPGQHGGTYAGNAVACAAASETLAVIEEEKIIDNVRERSKQLITGLRAMIEELRLPVLELRGLGLMIGIEFDMTKAGAGVSAAVSKACAKHGMVLLPTSKFETVRLIPPLNLTKNDADEALKIFRTAFVEIFGTAEGHTATEFIGRKETGADTPCRWTPDISSL